MTIVPYLFIFLVGINIGSFLNVCIYRISLGKTIARGRSYCPKCGKLIPFYDNIPLFSYMILGGRCRKCQATISPLYPFVELLNGLLYVAVFFVHGFSFFALAGSILVSILIVISFIDLKYQIIPDGLVIAILILALIHIIYQKISGGGFLMPHVTGFFAASLPLFILALFYEDGLGGGDIKLMAAAGLFLGWKLILLGLFLGNLMALAYVVFLGFQKKVKRGTAIPFGPFLSGGILGALLFGTKILLWYTDTFFSL